MSLCVCVCVCVCNRLILCKKLFIQHNVCLFLIDDSLVLDDAKSR